MHGIRRLNLLSTGPWSLMLGCLFMLLACGSDDESSSAVDACVSAEGACSEDGGQTDGGTSASDAVPNTGDDTDAMVGTPPSPGEDAGAAPVNDAGSAPPMGMKEPDDVFIRTRLGDIVIRLNADLAPITVENFLGYVDAGFFDGRDGGGATIFHRVISDFMVQGGGVLETGQLKRTRAPIAIESMNGLRNLRGTVAMARTNDPNSATSQFFINHTYNCFLDYSEGNPGYAVFGEVIQGMETVDAIAAEATGPQDVPRTPIPIIQAIRWVDAEESP